MADAIHYFPRSFKWGTATASHQVEGNNVHSDWWAWEQLPNTIHGGDKSGAACDWWGGRYKDDFDLAAEGGQNAHRMSIEWARVEPRPAIWDEDALQQYREILQALHRRGLEPMVTLCHFCHPQWFTERGGWERADAAHLFERYVRKVVKTLSDLVSVWCTLNEPNAFWISAYVAGVFPPGKTDVRLSQQVNANMYRAHVTAYHAVHALQPEAQVGWAMYIRLLDPARPEFAPDRWVAKRQHNIFNDAWARASVDGYLRTVFGRVSAPEGKGALDWIGVNYYTRDMVAFDISRPRELFGRRFFNPADELSETGFIASYPEGLYRALRWANQFGKPIYVTESGVEDSSDTLRPRYLLSHLRQVWRATNFNWPVCGYFHWTLVDNFEWERGWSQRFGLYALDTATQQRTPRPSAHLYAEICKSSSISTDMAARYAPELLETMFPG